MNTELLGLIDQINESDYKIHPGYFMPFAAKIKFSFTSEDYVASLEAYKKYGTINQHLKIIIHEYIHFFQRAYTTHGYYNQLIEQFKVAIAVNITRYIIESNHKINDSLIRIIESHLSLVEDDYLTKLLFNWLDADIVYSYINFDYDKYNAKYEYANKIRVDLPVIYSKFLSLEKDLFEYLQFSSRIKGVPSEIFEFRTRDIESLLKTEETNATNKILNVFPSLNGVLESYSKASELYLDRENFNLDYFEGMVIPPDKADYYVPLMLASRFIRTNDPTEFLLTYLAICDLALSPPLLPNLAQLRNDSSSIDNIDPCYRFYLLLYAQSGVRPLKNLDEDYNRYINEICSLLNWATPQHIAEKAVDTLQIVEGDLESYIFYESQKRRLLHSSLFLNIESFLLYLTDNLTHCPITEFSNTVFINRFMIDDLPFAYSEVSFPLQYLAKQFWLRILTTKPSELGLYFPYQAEKSTFEIYSNSFCQLYQQFGINLSNIKITNLPL